jgi:tetratricopeptide (TPR) repeat protein
MMGSDKKVTSFVSSNKDAFREYVKGLEKFDKGLYDESIEDFNRAIEIDSSFALPYMRIGMVHTFQGRLEQGRRYLSLAQERSENLPVKERMLLDIYADLWLYTNIDDAFVKIKSYVKNYPDDWEGRFFYAVFLFQLGEKYDAALAQVDTMLMINPRSRWGLSLSATIHASQEEYDKAVEKVKLVKSYFPDSPQPYLELSNLYRQMKNYDLALSEISQLLEIDPDNYDGIIMGARMNILRRDFDKARENLELLKKYYSDNPHIMNDYEDLQINLEVWEGDFLDAIDHYHKLIDYALKTEDRTIIQSAYSSFANYFLNFDYPDSVVKYAEKAHEYAQLFENLNYALTLVELDTSYCSEAEDVLKEVLSEFRERMPENIWPIANYLEEIFYGTCSLDTMKVIEAYDTLFNSPLNMGVASTAFALGSLMVSYGMYEEGLKYLDRITTGDLATSSALRYLKAVYYIGVAEQELGNYAEARKNFEEMLKYWGDPQIETDKIIDARKRMQELPS